MKIKLSILSILLSLTFTALAQTGTSSESEDMTASFLVEKFTRNVVLYAYDTDQPWSLEMYRNKTIELLMAPDYKVIASVYKKEKNKAENKTYYYAKFEHGNIQLEVHKSKCEQPLNASNTPRTVTLHYHDTLNDDYKLLEGCAEWIPNYRLHDIWMLYQTDNNKFDKEKYYKNVPRLEFHLNSFKVHGYSGCNAFEGDLVLNKKKLKIQNIQLLGDEKCELSKLEKSWLDQLQKHSYKFSFKDNQLTLEHPLKTFIFQRTD